MSTHIWRPGELDHIGERKNVFVMETKAGSVDVEKRTLRAVFSSNRKDRQEEVVHPQAFVARIATFKANPIVLWNHQAWGRPPIGKATSLEIGESTIEGDIRFRDAGKDEMADNVFDAYATGFLSTFSIGFRIFARKDAERDQDGRIVKAPEVTDAELFEISCVPIPANTDAMAKAVKAWELCQREQFRNGDQDAIFHQPSDLDVLARAMQIAKEIRQRKAKGLAFDKAAWIAVEDLHKALIGATELPPQADKFMSEMDAALKALASV